MAYTARVDEPDEWARYVYSDVNTEIEWEEMLQKLCPTYQRSDSLAPKPPKMTKTKVNGNSTYCDYLNRLSAIFQKNGSFEYTIKFRPKKTKNPPSHPMETVCHPDIVALRECPASASRIYSNSPHWSHLEATGKEHSGKSIAAGEAQTAAYTAYHLQARPDLVSVVGIFVSRSHFKLFFSNACRVYHTQAIEWSSSDARKLLYAWMWRLYHPELDHSITVDMKTSRIPTFTVTTADNKKHDLLVVLRAGESIDRRTIILARHDHSSSIVIKEQYAESRDGFREGAILEKIHQDGWFPGVVRLDSHEYVRNGDQKISVESKEEKIARSKTRLVLKDRGTRLADVKTPRGLLMGIYDLLEISRILWRKYKILHRDISPGNVLLGDGSTISTEPLRRDLGDMCFSEYLLEDPAGQDDSDLESDRRRRLMTRVITIDFEVGEGQDPGDPSLADPKTRVGTPIFMARMVCSNQDLAGWYELPPMPDVAPELLEHYQRTLKARLEDFPANKEEIIKVPANTKIAFDGFQHLLRYDAESVFWYLLWCCMRAQPEKELPEEEIPDSIWASLTGGAYSRNALFIRGGNFLKHSLHSSYAELVPLLDDMREHLQGDLAFSKTEERTKNPEYTHEAFQRLILNFLFANKTKPFMDLEKSDQPRCVRENPMGRSGTTRSTKSTYEEYPGTIDNRPKKRQRRK